MRHSSPILYDTFRQRVRRHRRSDLLRSVAALATRIHVTEYEGGAPLNLPNYVTTFALAGIARTALIAANEHRDPGSAASDLFKLCRYYVNVEDPALSEEPGLDRLRRTLNRIAYEQFGFQYSLMENVGRTLPLFLDHRSGCPGAPTDAQWETELGIRLEDFVRLGFVLHVAAVRNGGRVTRDLLRADHVAPIFTPLTPAEALEIVDRHFARTLEQLRSDGAEGEQAGLEKWSFNPLVATPVVKVDDSLIAPIPRLVIDRVTPTGLYFDGLGAWGATFTDALGCMFQKYVGTQLALLEHAVVHPEVTFGRPEKKTVDYFVVTPEIVLLVEVKASRPIFATRLGTASGDDDFVVKIGRAVSQIERTAKLIREKHPSLKNIPLDRPLGGLVVTLEPFHLAVTFLYENLVGTPDIPIAIASSHELEGFVAAATTRSDVGHLLHSALNPPAPTPPSLAKAVGHLTRGPNPILSESWDRFTKPFSELSGWTQDDEGRIEPAE